jgi:hypothetical protein
MSVISKVIRKQPQQTAEHFVVHARTPELLHLANCHNFLQHSCASLTYIDFHDVHLAVAKCGGDVRPRPEVGAVFSIPYAPVMVPVAGPLRCPIDCAVKRIN